MALASVILGLDPGYDRLGWGVLERQGQRLAVLDYGCIQTNKQQTLNQRYQQILTDFSQVIDKYHPQEAAIEELFFSKNSTTALKVAQARGMVMGQLIERQVPIFEYNPGSIKLAVAGHGRADKAAMTKMVRLQLKLDPDQNIIDDAIDALGVALTHAVTNKPYLA